MEILPPLVEIDMDRVFLVVGTVLPSAAAFFQKEGNENGEYLDVLCQLCLYGTSPVANGIRRCDQYGERVAALLQLSHQRMAVTFAKLWRSGCQFVGMSSIISGNVFALCDESFALIRQSYSR